MNASQPPSARFSLRRSAAGSGCTIRLAVGVIGHADEPGCVAAGDEANFGLWGTRERNLSFGPRDFDETLPGPFEWDVKRFAASLVVAAQENQLESATADAAVTAGGGAYFRRLRRD